MNYNMTKFQEQQIWQQANGAKHHFTFLTSGKTILFSDQLWLNAVN